jgi:FkbM family methyltransferase
MQFLHRLRLGTNKLLGPLGLMIERIEKQKWSWGNPVTTTQVGKYCIDIPRTNPLSAVYLKYPVYSGQLGRLASIIRKKYANLAAIDIGANVGDTACIIKTAEDIPLLCIEGDDYTFGLLKKNLKQFQNSTAYKLFLGEKTGVLSASLEKAGWNTTILPGESKDALSLNITSLDDFLATHSNTENFKLLKIDTEGFDCAILRGSTKFIQHVHPIIIFEYNRDNMEALGEKGLDTLSMLADLGYSHLFFHDGNGRFFCSANMSDQALIRDLHDYADGKHGTIYYFDITLFHEQDRDIAQAFAQKEREWRQEF